MPTGPVKFTRYCLSLWISKLPGSSEIPWVTQHSRSGQRGFINISVNVGNVLAVTTFNFDTSSCRKSQPSYVFCQEYVSSTMVCWLMLRNNPKPHKLTHLAGSISRNNMHWGLKIRFGSSVWQLLKCKLCIKSYISMPVYSSDILCGISKGTFGIPHIISHPYTKRCTFYSDVERQHFWTPFHCRFLFVCNSNSVHCWLRGNCRYDFMRACFKSATSFFFHKMSFLLKFVHWSIKYTLDTPHYFNKYSI